MARATRASIELAARDSTGPAFASVAGRFKGLEGGIDGLAGRFAGLAGLAAGAFGAAGLTSLLAGVVDGLDAFNDLSDATGASIENISRLDAAARRTGGSFDDVQAALLKFNQALNSAKAGSEQAAVFDALGLSVEELRRQDPAEALLTTARAFQKFGQDGEAARAQTLLLGRSVGTLAPLLKDLAEDGAQFGAVTRQQAEAAEAFNKGLARVNASTQDLVRGALADLLPVFNEVLDQFKSAETSVGGLAQGGGILRTALEAVVIVGANVAFTLKAVGREIGAIAAQSGALARLDLQGFNAISDAVKADAERARAELDKFEQRVLRAGRIPQADYSNEGRQRTQQQPTLQVRPTAASRGTAARAEIPNAIRDPINAQLQAFLRSEKDYEGAQKALDQVIKDGEAKQAERARELEAIIGASKGARFDALVEQVDKLSAAYREGEIGLEEYSRGAEVLGERLAALDPAVEKAAEKVSTFAEEASRNIQDALGDSLQSALSGDFDSIGDLWESLIIRMVAQAAAAQLNQYLFGAAVGSGGGVLGGVLGGLFGGFRAEGGPVQAGRAYVVGERGPEIMVPSSSGTVIPNGGGMGGGVSITYGPGSIVVGDGVSRAQFAATLEANNRAQEARIRQLLARNQVALA